MQDLIKADVLTSTLDASGEIRVNVGDSITGEGIGQEIAVFGVLGLYARPCDSDDSGAAQVLYQSVGHQKRIVAARDNRWIAGYGQLAAGDVCLASDCDAKIMVKRANNAITIYTANETDGGSTMLIDVNGVKGNILVLNGGAYIEIKKDSIVLSAGGSMLVVNAKGVATYGPHTALNTKSGNLGVVGGIAPPAGANSILGGPVGIAGIPAPFWTVSPA